eukprot:1137595-Pelagomonas_calceolata.AAC.2
MRACMCGCLCLASVSGDPIVTSTSHYWYNCEQLYIVRKKKTATKELLPAYPYNSQGSAKFQHESIPTLRSACSQNRVSLHDPDLPGLATFREEIRSPPGQQVSSYTRAKASSCVGEAGGDCLAEQTLWHKRACSQDQVLCLATAAMLLPCSCASAKPRAPWVGHRRRLEALVGYPWP